MALDDCVYILVKDLSWIINSEEFASDQADFIIRSSEVLSELHHIDGIESWVKDNEILSDDMNDFVVSSTDLQTYISNIIK